MLVLSRKPSQKVVIETPEGRRIEVLAISGCYEKVRLGFDADPAIKIYRPEVADRYSSAAASRTDDDVTGNR